MQRLELNLSDQEIIDIIRNNWNFLPNIIKYIDIGSTFAFILEDAFQARVFLKIYQEDKPSNPIESQIAISLNLLCNITNSLHTKFNINNIPHFFQTNRGEYLCKQQNYIFLLSNFIEGNHPLYEPNALYSSQLTDVFTKLHSIPTYEFSHLKKENFDINYALGIKK